MSVSLPLADYLELTDDHKQLVDRWLVENELIAARVVNVEVLSESGTDVRVELLDMEQVADDFMAARAEGRRLADDESYEPPTKRSDLQVITPFPVRVFRALQGR